MNIPRSLPNAHGGAAGAQSAHNGRGPGAYGPGPLPLVCGAEPAKGGHGPANAAPLPRRWEQARQGP